MKRKATKPASVTPLTTLRRDCVEMALHSQFEAKHNYNGGMGGAWNVSGASVESVVERAEQIFAWITK